MAYENLRLNDKELLELFKATADIGVVGVHCELGDEVNSRVARLLAEGKTGPEWHPRSRPNEVESLAVRRCLALAREAGGNAWVVHLSTGRPGGDRGRARYGPARAGRDLPAVPYADGRGLRKA
mgnify:CR=1 FL=1